MSILSLSTIVTLRKDLDEECIDMMSICDIEHAFL